MSLKKISKANDNFLFNNASEQNITFNFDKTINLCKAKIKISKTFTTMSNTKLQILNTSTVSIQAQLVS